MIYRCPLYAQINYTSHACRHHIGLARKMNDFLQSGADDGAEVKVHAEKMERWLGTLEAQLAADMPTTPRAGAPDIRLTWDWVRAISEGALDQVDEEMTRSGCIGYNSAWKVQQVGCFSAVSLAVRANVCISWHIKHINIPRHVQALMAALVTGCFCPPCRIHVLISLIHPSFNGRICCQDPDCALDSDCMGNHLELESIGAEEEADALANNGDPETDLDLAIPWQHFDYGLKKISNVIVHQKNDRWAQYMHAWRYVCALTCVHITHI